MSAWPGGVPARLPAEDRLDIEETYARYAWGLDLADEPLLLSAFAPDAGFDHLWQGRVQGHEAILKAMRELWYDRQHWWIGRQHLFSHFLMTPTEEGARVRCFFQIVQFNVDYGTNFLFGIGTRHDQLVKAEGGAWLFQELHVNAWRSLEDIPWQGDLTVKGRPKYPTAPSRPARD
jgi:hypothetical protein